MENQIKHIKKFIEVISDNKDTKLDMKQLISDVAVKELTQLLTDYIFKRRFEIAKKYSELSSIHIIKVHDIIDKCTSGDPDNSPLILTFNKVREDDLFREAVLFSLDNYRNCNVTLTGEPIKCCYSKIINLITSYFISISEEINHGMINNYTVNIPYKNIEISLNVSIDTNILITDYKDIMVYCKEITIKELFHDIGDNTDDK